MLYDKFKHKNELKLLAEMGDSILENLEELDIENMEKLCSEDPDYIYSKLHELALKRANSQRTVVDKDAKKEKQDS